MELKHHNVVIPKRVVLYHCVLQNPIHQVDTVANEARFMAMELR